MNAAVVYDSSQSLSTIYQTSKNDDLLGIEVTAMNTPEHLILVSDGEGRSVICKLDHECSESVDNNGENPRKFKDLSEHERSSCKVLVGDIFP